MSDDPDSTDPDADDDRAGRSRTDSTDPTEPTDSEPPTRDPNGHVPFADLAADAEAPTGASIDGDATRVDGEDGSDDDRREHVVNKREYCQQCPHLADPPALACTHEGTAIVEALDGDDLRVRGCPLVEEATEPN